MVYAAFLSVYLFRWHTSSLSSSLLLILLNLVTLTAGSKDLVKVVLAPSNVRIQSSELPFTVNLLVPMLICAVCMTLHQDLRSCFVLVPLVRYTQLMPADDLVVGHLLELRGAAEVLCHEGLVAEDERTRNHADEFIGRHGFPDLVQEGSVVNSKSWGDDLLETLPVLHVLISDHFQARLFREESGRGDADEAKRRTCGPLLAESRPYLAVIAVSPLEVGSEDALVIWRSRSARNSRRGQTTHPRRRSACCWGKPQPYCVVCVVEGEVKEGKFTCAIGSASYINVAQR